MKAISKYIGMALALACLAIAPANAQLLEKVGKTQSNKPATTQAAKKNNANNASTTSSTTSITDLEQKARNGNVEAMKQLAQYYFNGTGGVSRDREKALKYWAMAAKEGDMNAVAQMGRCYHYGWGTKADTVRAHNLYIKAIKGGCNELLPTLKKEAENNNMLSAKVVAECYKDGTNLLSQLLNSTDIPRTRRKTYIVEFHCMDEAGNLTVRSRKYFTGELEEILSSTDGDNAADLSFELGDTYLVRITVSNDYPILPSGTVTSPSTSFTGTGTLGGVGSLGSGSGTVLFRGSAYSHHDPQPASGGGGNPVDPDPVPSDPDPDPDPPAPDPPAPAPDLPAPDPDPDPNPEASLPAAAASDRRVIVSPQGRYYTVHVYFGTREADEPGQKITVRMKFKLPAGWSKNALFAVFRNADRSLTVIRADYDEDENTLSFDTDLTGTFALIFFPFDEDSSSEDFYEAISELDEIRLLPVRR